LNIEPRLFLNFRQPHWEYPAESTHWKTRWNCCNFQFIFDPVFYYEAFSYTAKVQHAAFFHIGLDGVYRFTDTDTDIGPFAAFGCWTSPDTCKTSIQQIGHSAPLRFILTIDQDEIEVTEVSLTGSYTYSGKIQ
jgi:hypothetical protein